MIKTQKIRKGIDGKDGEGRKKWFGVETENINVQITSILSNILLIALRKLTWKTL